MVDGTGQADLERALDLVAAAPPMRIVIGETRQ
jgi:hypothetical protein